MGRKATEEDIKEVEREKVEKVIKDVVERDIKDVIERKGIEGLIEIDVRDKVFIEVVSDIEGDSKKEIEYKGLYEDYCTYCSGDVIVKTCIGKKWAHEKRFDYDYDASLYANYIYRKVYDIFGGTCPIDNSSGYEYKIESNGDEYRGDTMNSWETTLNEFMRLFGGGKNGYLKNLVIFKGNGKWCRAKSDSANSWIEYLSNLDNYQKPLPWYIMEFMDVVYTIGNFIPLPDGCNVPRGSGKTKDYWDLALKYIYDWYLEDEKKDEENIKCLKKQKYLEELLSGGRGDKKEVVTRCANWLRELSKDKTVKEQKGQEGWNNFVKNTFMAPFVEKDGTDFGKPRELWDGHFTGNVLPEFEWQFEQFFVNARVHILERGRLIAEKLAEQFRAENIQSNE